MSNVALIMRMWLTIAIFVVGLAASASAAGTYAATGAAGTGATVNVDNPTNSDGNKTNMTDMTISNGGTGKVYKKNVDYLITGLGSKNVEITWMPGKKPTAGETILFAGSTPANGAFVATVTWP